jgi:hypothetical protein
MTTELGRMETEIWMGICDRENGSSGKAAGWLTTADMSALITRDRPLLLSPEQKVSIADRHSDLEECATLARPAPLVWEILKREEQHCTALPARNPLGVPEAALGPL